MDDHRSADALTTSLVPAIPPSLLAAFQAAGLPFSSDQIRQICSSKFCPPSFSTSSAIGSPSLHCPDGSRPAEQGPTHASPIGEVLRFHERSHVTVESGFSSSSSCSLTAICSTTPPGTDSATFYGLDPSISSSQVAAVSAPKHLLLSRPSLPISQQTAFPLATGSMQVASSSHGGHRCPFPVGQLSSNGDRDLPLSHSTVGVASSFASFDSGLVTSSAFPLVPPVLIGSSPVTEEASSRDSSFLSGRPVKHHKVKV